MAELSRKQKTYLLFIIVVLSIFSGILAASAPNYLWVLYAVTITIGIIGGIVRRVKR